MTTSSLLKNMAKFQTKRVTDLQLEDFLQYGPQNKQGKNGKPLLRKMKDGRVLNWNVQSDDPLCTLQEAFEKGQSKIGLQCRAENSMTIT
eukprot:UN01717